jgi:hypothetical protein
MIKLVGGFLIAIPNQIAEPFRAFRQRPRYLSCWMSRGRRIRRAVPCVF